jgi:hypothetical protein
MGSGSFSPKTVYKGRKAQRALPALQVLATTRRPMIL